ncbi:MAG: hypothetical protein LKJ25_10030 [Clostridia bacterium]|nr:hypothetical protein [Clostridia bacterium]
MKRKFLYIAVCAMIMTGTGCANTAAGSKATSAVTSQASSSASEATRSSDESQKPAENMLTGKVTSVADGALTLETMGGPNGGQEPDGNNDSAVPPEKSEDNNAAGTASSSQEPEKGQNGTDASVLKSDSSEATVPSEEQSDEKTIALTDDTQYYKESDGTKTDASESDVAEGSMVRIEYEKDESSDELTAVSVTIMDSSKMNNESGQNSDNNQKPSDAASSSQK